VYLPGVTSNFLSVPDEAALDITGDIDIRVQVSMDDWTPAAESTFVSKRAGAGERSYNLAITTAGALVLGWTENGTDFLAATSTSSTSVADGTVKWVRVTLDVDNGASGYDAKFFLSDDGSTWTQLGTTITGGATTSIFASSIAVRIGERTSATNPAAGKFYRAQVFNGIDGTKVLDVDTSVLTSGAATTFTALTGQTVTINRSTAGRKAVAVVAPVWLFGTDDYMEVADNALLDFGATDSFTVLAVVRQWTSTPNNAGIIAKRAENTTASVGWAIRANSSGGAGGGVLSISDGTTNVADSPGSYTLGATTALAAVRNTTADTIEIFSNALSDGTTADNTTGTLSNAVALRIGDWSTTGNNADMELIAAAVFRRALTSTEISQITTYYQARLS
jgi:hypothetical protein